MTKSTDLAHRLREVLLSGRWIANTNYREQLMATTWEQALQKAGNHNSIAALTFHINYYLEGLLQVFNGGPLEIRDQYSFELPAIQAEADWQRLVDTLLGNAEKFIAAVERMTDEQLDAPFVDARYGTCWRNIEGVIEHSYYHLGQISLIKKLL